MDLDVVRTGEHKVNLNGNNKHRPYWSQKPGQGRRAAPAWCGLRRTEAEEEVGKLLHP